jgi:prepilin-type N-terminal cleavage/methylation domain-containing protein
MLVSRPLSQRGFTLIEVLVTITILLVGVLGVVAMVDGANAIASKTKAREGGTNVARSIIEVARAVPYKNLTADALLTALDSRPGLADASPGADYTIVSRKVRYDVSVQVCSIDDAKDDLGTNDGTIAFCPESAHAASAASAKDRNPDDYKRVAVTLTWRSGGKVKQTALIANPVGGVGPSVIQLDPRALSGSPPTVTDGSTASIVFDVGTDANAAEVDWSVNGARQGRASSVNSSQRTWTFTWNINSPVNFYDCTYVVQAEAHDDAGRAGTPKAVTIVLNRARPIAPQLLEGGRNGNGEMVDLQWKPNPECDVLGYRVYRGPSATGPWTQITCLDQTGTYQQGTTCVDDNAPASAPLYYYVAAVDTLPSGGPGVGASSTPRLIVTGNGVPNKPTGVNACLGGSSGCDEPDGSSTASGVTVLRWDPATDPDGDPIYFYRIYRDGSTYADRVGQFFPGTGSISWTDPDSPNGSHTYRVSAVDPKFGESQLSDPVTFP